MSALQLSTDKRTPAPTAAGATVWLNVLVELKPPQADQMADLDRNQRYRLLADRTRQQRAELEMWLVAEEFDDQVKSITEMEAMGMLLLHCSPIVAAHLSEAPGVTNIAVTGYCTDNNQSARLQAANA